MKKIIAVVSSAALLSLVSVSSASAQKLADPGGSYSVSGALNLFQTVPGVFCNVSMTVNVDAAGVGSATGITFSPGHPLCGTAIFPIGPWPVRGINVATQEIEIDVDVIAAGGRCTGTLSSSAANVTLTQSPNRIVVPGSYPGGATVPGTPSTCYVDGILTVNAVPPTTGQLRVVP